MVHKLFIFNYFSYDSANYENRVNFYSNPEVNFGQIPTGNVENDNAKLIIQKRFLMAAVGKEQFSCSISGKIEKVIWLKKLVFILI